MTTALIVCAVVGWLAAFATVLVLQNALANASYYEQRAMEIDHDREYWEQRAKQFERELSVVANAGLRKPKED